MIYGSGANNERGNRDYLADVLGIASFIVGMANYGENLSQRSAQELLDAQTKEIHEHLRMQDEKINLILKKLGGKESGL